MGKAKRFRILRFEQLNEIMVSVDLKDLGENKELNVIMAPPAFDDFFDEYGYDKVFSWEIEKEDTKNGVIGCVKYAEFDDCVYPE